MSSREKLIPEQLLDMLDAQGIRYAVAHHKPVFTVEESRSIRPPEAGEEGQIKNLFLKNKKGRMWLLSLHESREVDLKEAAQALGARRFSFCSPERLMRYLGVVPGAVTPFALLNDHDREVQFCLDEALLSHRVIHAHPLVNSSTVSIGLDDLIRFLDSHGHPCRILPLNLETV